MTNNYLKNTSVVLGAAALAVGIAVAAGSAWSATQAAAPADPTVKTEVTGSTNPAETTDVPQLTVKKTEISNFDFWQLQCDQFSDAKIGKRCAARLPVFKANTQQMLAVLVISQDNSKQWQLKIIIPTSISIPPGASINFDGATKAVPIEIETCEPAACSSTIPMDANIQAILRQSGKVSLTYTAIDKNPVKFDFEIKGIQATMKALFG